MTAARRIVSGSAATFASIILGVVLQLVLVPIYLVHWGKVTFGLWLGVQAAQSLINLADLTLQDYIGFECLKLPPDQRRERSQIFSDGLPAFAVTGCIQLLLAAGAVIVIHGAKPGPGLISAATRPAAYALATIIVYWVFYQGFLGSMARVLASLGHFSRFAWWALATSLCTGFAPGIAAYLGFGLFGAALFSVSAGLLIGACVYVDCARLMMREQIMFVRPNARNGLARLGRSLVMAAAAFLESFQQTGFRLVILPIIGPSALTQFSTLRTVANVAQQGLGAIINPSLPELMRAIAVRDNQKIHGLLGMLWLTIVVLAAPAFMALQIVGKFIFHKWTRGHVEFDAMAFALMSSAIMIFSLSQPNRSIVRGNNLAHTQLIISMSSGAVLLLLSLALVPRFGVVGAALCLVVGEIVRSIGTMLASSRWLKNNDLSRPNGLFGLSAYVVTVTVLSLVFVAQFPRLMIPAFVAFLLLWAFGAVMFARAMPEALIARLIAPRDMIMSRLGLAGGGRSDG